MGQKKGKMTLEEDDMDFFDRFMIAICVAWIGFLALLIWHSVNLPFLQATFIDFNTSSLTSGASIGLYSKINSNNCILAAEMQSGINNIRTGFSYSTQVIYTPLPPSRLQYYITEYNKEFNQNLQAC